MAGLADVGSVAAGAYHSLALTTGGRVWAWGWNYLGQVGDGSASHERRSPVAVSRLGGGASSIAAGAYHSLAGAAEDVWTWGWNGFGQLGDRSTQPRGPPCGLPAT